MKKLFMLLSALFMFSLLSLSVNAEENNPYCQELQPVAGAVNVKVGMVTDSGTIDDKSFNQGTWQGIQCYDSKNDADIKYLQPGGEAKENYMSSINNLIDSGYQMIVAPGFKFEEAIFQAQTDHPTIKFVIIDGAPHSGDFVPNIKSNTVSVMFAEEQAGFLAGVAAAKESKSGKLGFVGGMAVPAVQKFGWGFVAGVAYANKNLGTNAHVIDYVYQGTFTETQAGQTLANGMYEKGIDIIFAAAGGVGVGVINEAKTRAEKGEKVWVVGVDVDQYESGKYGTEGKSVILTSAMKRIDVAAYNYVGALATNTFEGGKQVTYNVDNNGVGLPAVNPNLTSATVTTANDVKDLMKNDTIKAPTTVDELTSFLSAQGHETPKGVYYTTDIPAADEEGNNTVLIVSLVAVALIGVGAFVFIKRKRIPTEE